MGAVGRSGHVRRVEELGCTEGIAGAGGTVADADDLVFTVQVGDLVDIALFLGAFQDLHDLIVGDVAGILVGLHQVFRHVADSQAHIAFDIADAFAAHGLLSPAGTYIDAEFIVLFQPVGKMFHADGAVFVLDGFFDRDHVHTQAAASRGNKACHFADRIAGGVVEECGNLRVILEDPGCHHHVFTGTDDPFRNEILAFAGFVLTVKFHQPDLADAECHGFSFFRGHPGTFGHLGSSELHRALLFEGKHEPDLLFGQQTVKDPVIRQVRSDLFGTADTDIIRDQAGEFFDQLILFRIGNDKPFIEEVVLVVHVVLIFFRYHLTAPPLIIVIDLWFGYGRDFFSRSLTVCIFQCPEGILY